VGNCKLARASRRTNQINFAKVTLNEAVHGNSDCKNDAEECESNDKGVPQRKSARSSFDSSPEPAPKQTADKAPSQRVLYPRFRPIPAQNRTGARRELTPNRAVVFRFHAYQP
jgi:hypothetical protein